MQFPDEILMAYADGELDADVRRQIEAAMALDPTIGERIEKHRSLRADLGAAFNPVLDEPIPNRLIDATTLKSATVTDLNVARAAKHRATYPKNRWGLREWGAIAASLIIGILAGRSALQPSESDLFATTAEGIVARGPLWSALTDHVGATSTEAEVRIGLTFRDKSGQYCRTFVTDAVAGFACRGVDAWNVRTLSEGTVDAQTGEYRTAGSELPPTVLAAIEQNMAGEALDREQELAARARNWKK